MKKITKDNKAITLIALVITIIVLLILAGITVTQLSGNNLFENAKLAKEKYKIARELEDETLVDYENEINGSRDTVIIPKEEYEQLKTSVANLQSQVNNNLEWNYVGLSVSG